MSRIFRAGQPSTRKVDFKQAVTLPRLPAQSSSVAADCSCRPQPIQAMNVGLSDPIYLYSMPTTGESSYVHLISLGFYCAQEDVRYETTWAPATEGDSEPVVERITTGQGAVAFEIRADSTAPGGGYGILTIEFFTDCEGQNVSLGLYTIILAESSSYAPASCWQNVLDFPSWIIDMPFPSIYQEADYFVMNFNAALLSTTSNPCTSVGSDDYVRVAINNDFDIGDTIQIEVIESTIDAGNAYILGTDVTGMSDTTFEVGIPFCNCGSCEFYVYAGVDGASSGQVKFRVKVRDLDGSNSYCGEGGGGGG